MQPFAIPEDYKILDRESPFSDLTGPYYEKRIGGEHIGLALLIEQKHTNKIGIAHGGALITLADNAFGDAVKNAFDEPVSFVTVTMNNELMDPARLGDWVEAEVEILRKGKRMIFVACTLRVGDKKILHASGVMALVNKPA